MGKGKRDEDDGLSVAPEGDPARGLSGSRLDPDRSQQEVRTRTRQRSRSRVETRSETIDQAALQRATAAAYEAGAASNRASLDSTAAALDKANVTIAAKDRRIDELLDKNQALVDRLQKVAEQNVSLQLLENASALDRHKVSEMHGTLRHVADRAGPGVAPVVGFLVRKFAPGLIDPPEAAIGRLVAYLMNGSEASAHTLGMLEEMAGPTDWPLVIAWLGEMAEVSRIAQQVAPAQLGAGAQQEKVH